ncbi:MAG: hypothetical protein KUG73_11480 [Pseudomonadales bacterium]|nr:hypothetical protein [Pseudomonadales bacterium]
MVRFTQSVQLQRLASINDSCYGAIRTSVLLFLAMIVSSYSVASEGALGGGEYKLDWEVGTQARLFAEGASYGQSRSDVSVRAQAEFYYQWNDGEDSIEFIPWFVIDKEDDERTHGDIQDLAWIHVSDDWELRTGIRKVFWGVTETVHLVDIINQSDLSRGLDGEDKLGQPMINLSLVNDWGIVDFFVLPGHRKRIFAGEDGRPRSTFVITRDHAQYESGEDSRRVDAAFRWQTAIDDWEFALSHFSGTSREPTVKGLNNKDELLTYYPIIDQTGLEAQYIAGEWIWKLESVSRSGQGNRYTAAVVGAEYTQVGIFDTDIDLGWIAESSFDDRGFDAPHASERDIVVGTRWTLNDVASSQALFFVSVDSATKEQIWTLEASRRFYADWFVTIDMFVFANTGEAPTIEESLDQFESGGDGSNRKLAAFTRDSYIQFEVIRYF